MSGISRLARLLESAGSKPSFFSRTHYDLPTDKQMEEIHAAELSAKEIHNGIGYSIIGRGMRGTEGTKGLSVNQMMRKAHEMLIDKYPDYAVYKEAMQLNNADEEAWRKRTKGRFQ